MNFYVMKQDVTSNEDTYAERMEPIKTGDFDICEICGQALGLRKWVPPYNVKFKGGAKGDIVYVDYLDILVSQFLMEAYKRTDLRGILSFKLVENLKVTGKKGSAPIPKYYKIDLVRSGTRIDEKRSQFKREFDEGEQYCQVCQTGGEITSLKGLFLDVNSWTGEDIFYAKGLPSTIIATQRFVDFIRSHKFRNAFFDRAEEYRPSWIL